MVNQQEIAKIKELARLFVIFFQAHLNDLEVDRDDVQAGYDLIESFAGKEALNALKLADDDYGAGHSNVAASAHGSGFPSVSDEYRIHDEWRNEGRDIGE